MAIQSTKKSWGYNRSINYVGKDFSSLKQNLIDYTKSYFPDTYSDFSEASPGMIFIDMAAFIGDLLSFYQDTQLKESILTYASERKNILALAQAMGYKPKVTTPAVTTLTVYQLVPSVFNSNGKTGTNYEPDASYYLRIKEGMQVSSNENASIIFRTTEVVDFSKSTGRTISVYQTQATTNIPELYLVSKKVKAISAQLTDVTITIPSTITDYPTIELPETNVISIISVAETNTNTSWYEVPYLAQDTIFSDKPNIDYNSNYSQFSSTVPYILELQRVSNRFCVRVGSDNRTILQFGNGNGNQYDETLLPSPKNVGLGLASSIERLNSSIDPSNFLKSNTLGISPAGKTLNIKYLVGGGVNANVNSNTLTTISFVNYDEDLLSVANLSLYNTIKQSVAVENNEPATGGRGVESNEEIRQNAIALFSSQNRAVTRQDYIIRALNMPEKYGSVAKVYVAQDSEIDTNSQVQNNPFAINMYTLGFDSNKKLTTLNEACKFNLKTYISEYRMLTDAVNILDGFVVNIGVDFDVIVYSNYNKSEVVSKCLNELKSYFNIDNWTFNKPINISELELILANIEGVMSVPSVKIRNVYDDSGMYSKYVYNIDNATIGKIIYPSLDPSIFEVKYPNKDIRGRAL